VTAAAAILDRLAQLGVAARADGDALRLRPASMVPTDLLAEVRALKPTLLALLAANDPTPAPVPTGPAAVAAWAERAAARALDGYEPGAEADAPGWRADTAEELAGRRRAALVRPPSWTLREAHHPPPASTCSCCHGTAWWSRDRLGWCCRTCHPPPPGADRHRVPDLTALPLPSETRS
jgi:hypothetical protein